MNQQPKNKNPLLSCALTGGFEDLSTGIVLTTADKPVFTIGNAPVISDTDNFSEVSLDRDGNTSEIGHTSDLQTELTNPYYASPLSDLDSYTNLHDLQQQAPPTLDINSNSEPVINDGNLNPIAALGTAASTVFSTFSNIIKGSASQAAIIEDNQQHQYKETSIVSETYQDAVNINTYSYNQQSDSNATPPSFYSPNDELLFGKKPLIDTPSNTFRLGGSKKKTYAHIPGLSSSQVQSQSVSQNFNLNPAMPPLPPHPITHVDSMPNFQPPPPLQPQQSSFYENNQPSIIEKSTNKFSFSSLLDKIPVPMNIFGSSEQSNSERSYNYENQLTTTAVTPTVFQQPQTESINYFSPQSHLAEPQIGNLNMSAPNYFNSLQNSGSEQFSVTSTDSVDSQKSGQTLNTAVNFFDPQKFNTSPFTKVQQPSIQQGNEIVNNEVNNDNNNSSILTSSMSPQQSLPTTVFNANDQEISSENTTPPVFFNPTQASEMFKHRQNDEKPKNPYSNNRMRGVGLYRSRTSSDSSNAPQMFMPAAPSTQLITPFQNNQQQFNNDEVRPSSTPSVDQNNLNMPTDVGSNPTRTSVFESHAPLLPQMNFNMPQQTFTDFQTQSAQIQTLPFGPIEAVATPQIVQKKSDLNVPENETAKITASMIPVEPEQKIYEQKQEESQPQTIVSNFFSCDNNKVNEQVLALNFFQVEPEINSKPVVDCFGLERQKQDKLLSPNDSLNAINFFAINDASKVLENEEEQQCSENNNNMEMNDNNNDDVIKKEDIQEFNIPLTSSTIQANTDLVNDVTDKMESLSACSRSTLSLFATSELDSTMSQKILSSAPVESLIPKYLEQQPPVCENSKVESSMAASNHVQKYRPIYCHWFYQNLYWHPFSMTDSMAIDQAILNSDETVYTSGGRYEINIKDRRRSSIYWTSGSNVIKKCSWFYMDEKNGNQNLTPYDEHVADFLEKEYEKAMNCGVWNQKIHLQNSNDFIIMKDTGIIEHHKMEQILVVKRGVDEFDIDDGEEGTSDHLILCISGFGDKINENADEVRTKCLETIQQYYSEAFDCGQIKRIEVLPIILNSIDVLKMYEVNNSITKALPLKISSKEINDYIMRTMLYSNENFYQKIMNHLAFSMNEIVSKFNQRNLDFTGEISVMSSSYESLFLFDLLANDNDNSEFWKLNFNASKFFACGIPISLLTIRNGDKLKQGFELKRCKKLYNIIDPADEIAQRIEPLIMPEYTNLPPESIENLTCADRIDFLLPENSDLKKFETSLYFSSEILVRRITNEIYGAIEMDSGSL